MHNELTEKDIELMRQELNYRRTVLRPKLIEDVPVSYTHLRAHETGT